MAADGYDGPGWYWVDGEEDPLYVTLVGYHLLARGLDGYEQAYLSFKNIKATKIERPIPKPVVDWSAMPAWANWVAMDEDGTWCYFVNKPFVNHNEEWFGDSGCIPDDFAPKYNGDWRNSFVERPR